MKRILARYLSRYGEPVKEHVDSAVEQVWRKIEPEMGKARITLQNRAASNRARRLVPALAVAAVVALVVFLQMPRGIGAHAVVAEGSLSKIVGSKTESVHVGDRIEEGEVLRTGDANGSIMLADGSRVEMRSQSQFSIEHAADGVRIHLFRGGVIINAAKQLAGHLYVRTKDVTVSVVGTVFLVNAEEEGSRVAVIEGEVRVQQGATTTNLLPGDQLSTNPKMPLLAVPEELSWSRNAETHVALLQQSIPAPTPTPRRLRFEAASVRLLGDDTNVEDAMHDSPLRCRGVDGAWSTITRNGRTGLETPQGRCVGLFSLLGPNSALAALYDIRFDKIDAQQFTDIMWKTTYRVEAIAEDPGSATKEQLKQMIQTLLAERFKLQVRREARGAQKGYAMYVSKDGPKFKETTGDEEFTQSFTSNVVCQRRGIAPCPIILKGKYSMKSLAATLGMFWTGNGEVVDKTDLRAIYDLQLTLNPVPAFPASNTGGIRGGDSGPKPAKEYMPPLIQAVEEQLGLRLEYWQQVPVEWLVVDHFEKLSEN